MARTGHNATFSATSAHSRALGTGCVWLGRPSVRASHRRRRATRTRPTAQRCPPAGATTANETLPASSWFCRPNSNPAKICAFPPPSAGTHAAFCTSRVVVPGCVCGAPVARGSRAAPTPTRRLPQLLGRGRPRRLRTSGPLHPLRSAQLPTNATRRRALRSSGEPRDGRVGGGARRSRRPSRACRSHVSVWVTCSRRSQSRRTLSRSKEAVVRDRPRPEMFSSLAPAASGAVAAATETPAAAATRSSSFRG